MNILQQNEELRTEKFEVYMLYCIDNANICKSTRAWLETKIGVLISLVSSKICALNKVITLYGAKLFALSYPIGFGNSKIPSVIIRKKESPTSANPI